MKWPWVGRELYEKLGEITTEYARDRDRAEARLDEERKRVAELTGEILRMRREGFVPQPEPPTPEATMQLSQTVLDAIEERAFTPAMRRSLRQTAERMTRDGREDKDIATLILEGEQFEPEEMPL